MRKLALSLGMLALFACGSSEAPASSSSEGETPVPADEPQGATGATGETGETGETGATGGTAEPTTPAVEAPPPEAPPPVAADACARARSCCPAYAAALPSSGAADRAGGDQACASLELAIAAGGPAADEACQGALEGFRRSLEATGRDVPIECR